MLADVLSHVQDGTFGASYLHLVLAVVCFAVAYRYPIHLLAGLVCGVFYLLGIVVEYGLLPHVTEYTLHGHINYYMTFAAFDTVWLFALLAIRRYWAASIQLLFVLMDMTIAGDVDSALVHYDQQILIVMNVTFVAVLFYGESLTAWFCDTCHIRRNEDERHGT